MEKMMKVYSQLSVHQLEDQLTKKLTLDVRYVVRKFQGVADKLVNLLTTKTPPQDAQLVAWSLIGELRNSPPPIADHWAPFLEEVTPFLEPLAPEAAMSGGVVQVGDEKVTLPPPGVGSQLAAEIDILVEKNEDAHRTIDRLDAELKNEKATTENVRTAFKAQVDEANEATMQALQKVVDAEAKINAANQEIGSMQREVERLKSVMMQKDREHQNEIEALKKKKK